MYVKKTLKVHGKGDRLHVPTQGPLWIEMLRLYSQWFIHSLISVRFPKKEPFHEMWGKQSLSMEPHADRRPTYNGVRPGSPSGSLVTLLSLLQYHAAFSTIPSTLAWVAQSPISQRVIVTLIRCTLHTCYCLPCDPE